MRSAQSHVQLFAAVRGEPVRWRLLSGNNRELGRGTDSFETVESCVERLQTLQSGADRLAAAVVRDVTNHWTWSLAFDGMTVAVSGHRYDRLIRCRQGIDHFTGTFGAAVIGTSVMYTQARRWPGVGASV